MILVLDLKALFLFFAKNQLFCCVLVDYTWIEVISGDLGDMISMVKNGVDKLFTIFTGVLSCYNTEKMLS